MRLIIGLSKKIGLPGFGSVGATCQLESAEFNAELGSDDFERRAKRAFDACRKAVEEEIARHGGKSLRTSEASHPSEASSSNGESFLRERSMNARPPGSGGRPATLKQLNALKAMATKRRLSRGELNDVLGGKPFDALTIAEASIAIDRLQGGAAAQPIQGSRNGYAQGGS